MKCRTSASSPLPRWSLSAVCSSHAGLFFWVAAVLPWRSGTLFATFTTLLAVLHLATALAAGSRSAWLIRTWQILSWCSLSYLVWLLWDITSSAIYLGHIYGKLGRGLGAALMAVGGLFAVLTVPIALWGFSRVGTGKPQRLQRPAALLAPLLMGGAGYDVWVHTRTETLATDADSLRQKLQEAIGGSEASRHSKAPSLFQAGAALCGHDLAETTTLVVSLVNDENPTSEPSSRSLCLQGSPTEISESLQAALRHAAGSPIKLDWVESYQPMLPSHAFIGELVDSLAIRPGLDGVCAKTRCLMPWQLVARSWFASDAPLEFAEKLRIGFSLRAARAALELPEAARPISGLTRITTRSFVADAGELHPMRRLKQADVEVTPTQIQAAGSAALAHVLRAQHKDGSFRYHLDMMSGKAQSENPSIPRHAGTTLALCELGPTTPGVSEKQLNKAVARALRKLASFERRAGDVSALTYGKHSRLADVGSSALGLVALMGCRALNGETRRAGKPNREKHDELRARLGNLLLELLDEDGHFNPAYDLKARAVVQGPTPEFAAGQAIFALSLLEGFTAELPEKRAEAFPSNERLHQAVERAMDYYAEDYWPRPLRDMFFLRENWHCLAARAALLHHRHDGYERFCLDYVAFKSRFILDHESDVSPDFVGAMSFGNVFVPHNGSTAGLGEALGAAVAIKRARGESVEHELAQLRLLIGFLLRQQYTETNCFASQDPDAALGGFSGEMVAPLGRIDHVQHAWSAIGHGGAQLYAQRAAM